MIFLSQVTRRRNYHILSAARWLTGYHQLIGPNTLLTVATNVSISTSALSHQTKAQDLTMDYQAIICYGITASALIQICNHPSIQALCFSCPKCTYPVCVEKIKLATTYQLRSSGPLLGSYVSLSRSDTTWSPRSHMSAIFGAVLATIDLKRNAALLTNSGIRSVEYLPMSTSCINLNHLRCVDFPVFISSMICHSGIPAYLASIEYRDVILMWFKSATDAILSAGMLNWLVKCFDDPVPQHSELLSSSCCSQYITRNLLRWATQRSVTPCVTARMDIHTAATIVESVLNQQPIIALKRANDLYIRDSDNVNVEKTLYSTLSQKQIDNTHEFLNDLKSSPPVLWRSLINQTIVIEQSSIHQLQIMRPFDHKALWQNSPTYLRTH